MDGIRIPADVAREAGVPGDLDSSARGPYHFPSPTRRKVAARVYVASAVLAAIGALADLTAGFWAVSLGFLVLAYLHSRAAWEVRIGQEQALSVAAALAPFPIGHASAALGFVGRRSRPVWNVILYSSEDPPLCRALVRLEASTGEQLDDIYVEPLEQPQ